MYSLQEILDNLKLSYTRAGGGTHDTFDSVVPLTTMRDNSLVFCNKPNLEILSLLDHASNVVAILESKWGTEHRKNVDGCKASIFLVENPRLVVCDILKFIYPNEDVWEKGIHPSASVDPEAFIHPTVSVGHHAIIGKCFIGEYSRIGAFTIIRNDAVIGKNVTIREFCHIGGCGFGIVRDEKNNRLVRFPHIGRVIIEDDVELFPYVNVDRGALGDTLIKRGSKIDHYSHIGHNCTVGENTIITAGTVLCGGSSIGDDSWSGVGAIIKEKIAVGNNVTIGLGAVVTKSVQDRMVVAGIPAKPMKAKTV